MKKIITSLLLTFIGLTVYSQKKFESYDNSYIDKTYDIQIATKDSADFSLYIDALSLDDSHNNGGILIRNKKYDEFVTAILNAKLKYEEWVKTAKENNIKELNKTMAINSNAGSYFLYGNDWHFQFSLTLKFDFKILEKDSKVEYLLLVKTGRLQASDNQFMKVEGFCLIFSTSAEIDDFLSKISRQNIAKFTSKPTAEQLFKD